MLKKEELGPYSVLTRQKEENGTQMQPLVVILLVLWGME